MHSLHVVYEERHRAVDQPVPSFLIESVHPFAVRRQVAGRREGLAAGGAGVGADAGMRAHVRRITLDTGPK